MAKIGPEFRHARGIVLVDNYAICSALSGLGVDASC